MSPRRPNEIEERARLERRADAIRSRLMRTLDTLDQKRHDLLDIRTQVRRHVLPIAIAGAAAMLTLSGGVALLALRAGHTRSRRRRARWAALARVMRHPERVATNWEPVHVSLAKKALGAALGAIAAQFARRVLWRFVEPIPRALRASFAPGSSIPAAALYDADRARTLRLR